MTYRGKPIAEMAIPDLTEAFNETNEILKGNRIITPIGFENYTRDTQCLWQLEHYLRVVRLEEG